MQATTKLLPLAAAAFLLLGYPNHAAGDTIVTGCLLDDGRIVHVKPYSTSPQKIPCRSTVITLQAETPGVKFAKRQKTLDELDTDFRLLRLAPFAIWMELTSAEGCFLSLEVDEASAPMRLNGTGEELGQTELVNAGPDGADFLPAATYIAATGEVIQIEDAFAEYEQTEADQRVKCVAGATVRSSKSLSAFSRQ